MITLAEELPFAQAVLSENLSIACSNCFAIQEDPENNKNNLFPINFEPPKMQKCAKCLHISYCSKKCQIADWPHHKDECKFIINSKSCPSHVIRILSRMIVRVKNLDTPHAFNKRTIDDLVDPIDQILADPLATPDKLPYKDIVKFMGAENALREIDVLTLYGRFCLNHTTIYSDSWSATNVGVAVYIGLSAHKRSCRPECVAVFLGTKFLLKAIDPTTKQ